MAKAVLGYAVGRRHAASGFVQLTPGEYNHRDPVQDPVPLGTFDERPMQSTMPCRPSLTWTAFFLSPLGYAWADDFIMGHESIPRVPNTPRGSLSTQDERRNVAVPPRISYGAIVGEADGVAPYGLE